MKIEIKVPSSLSDIKLSQYQKFIRTTKDSEDENYVARQMVLIFCNLTDNIVDKMKPRDYESIVEDLTNVLTQDAELVTKFELDDVEYGFIPNFDDITVGEKADIDTFYKDLDTLDKAMAVMYRPITFKNKSTYLIEDYEGKGSSLDVTLDVAFGANVFFSTLTNDLMNYIQNCIADQAVQNPKVSQILAKNGRGIQAFMNSLEGMFSSLTKLQNLSYTKH